MTLPASGQISMSQVRTELGGGTAQISLGQTSVRTLFGVASGQIALSNGYGKSAVSIYRPTSYSVTKSQGFGAGGAVTNPANAYDTSTTTYAFMDCNIQNSGDTGWNLWDTYAFSAAGTFTGTLSVTVSASTIGSVGSEYRVRYSINSGGTWTNIFDNVSQAPLAQTTYNVSVSSITIANLRVECYIYNDGDPTYSGVTGDVWMNVYDIWLH